MIDTTLKSKSLSFFYSVTIRKCFELNEDKGWDALVKIFLCSECEGAEIKMPLESHLLNKHTNEEKYFALEDFNFKVEN